MTETLVLELAHRRVHNYADNAADGNEPHEDDLDCRDCEDFLRKGVDAYIWLRRAEETLREADYEGIFEFDRPAQEALDALYAAWLSPCDRAEKWIARVLERGDRIDKLNEFRRACEDVREIVERRDWRNRATRARVFSSSEEPW